MEALLFLGFIGLIIWNINLNGRVSQLEWRINQQKNKIASAKPKKTKKHTIDLPQAEEDLFPWETTDTPQTKQAKSLTKRKPQKEFHLENFLGKKFFAVLGITSIVLAIGFFSAWAFSNGLIGPKGRIALGILFSIVLLGVGEFIRPKYPKFFDKVSAAGIGGLLITLYLARNYDFADMDGHILTGTQAFWSYAVTVVTGVLLALRYNARFLGSFSIIAGIIIPLLVNAEPNPIGLLSYLSILTIAGFMVSLYKKWPEIIGFLFLGITGYLIGIYKLETTYFIQCKIDGDCPEAEQWQKIPPLLFLYFTYGLSFLLGSGGIIRSLRSATPQKIDKMDPQSTFEVLLFSIAIFSANLLGYQVFNHQGWEHFGFFVLAQGFGFFFLSELFKAKKLEVFQKLALAATLISIIFATIWEIGAENEFILTLLLAIEGALFCFAGRSTKEIIFRIFGRLAIMFAFFWLFHIDNFFQSTIAIIATIAVTLYSVGTPKHTWEKLWAGLSIILTSAEILYWSFDRLPSLFSYSVDLPTFIIPTLWAIGLAYSVLKTKEEFSRIAGLIFMGIVSFIGWDAFSSSDEFESVLILALLLFGNFSVLSSFFIVEKAISLNATLQKITTITILSLTTISVLVFGIENLDEPLRTISWIAWGGTLFGLGNIKSWTHFRYFGIGILLALIAKLYIVDVWSWGTMEKFAAFGAIGVSLLFISFLYAKKSK